MYYIYWFSHELHLNLSVSYLDLWDRIEQDDLRNTPD